MMFIDVDYHGYTYRLRHNGEHFTATDQRTGRVKKRLNYRCWWNVIGQTDLQPVTDQPELIDKLETGVNELKSLLANHQPYSPVSGTRQQHIAAAQRRLGKRNRERRDHAQN